MTKERKERKAWYRRVWVWIIIVILLAVAVTGIVWGSCDAIQKSLIRLTCKDEPSSLPSNYDEILAATKLVETREYGQNCSADVFMPATQMPAKPLIFYFHGGYYVGGGRHNQEPICRMLAAEGYTVINADYPLAPENVYPAQLSAANEAIGVFTSIYGTDEGIFIMGDSAGAHLASQLGAFYTNAALATEIGVQPSVGSDVVRGVVSYCGFFEASTVKESKFFMVGSAMRMLFGDRKYEKNPKVKQADIALWSDNYPSALLVCGDKDPFIGQNKAFASALEEKGRKVSTYFPTGGKKKLGHEFQADFKIDESATAFEKTLEFLKANEVG